MVEKEGGLRKTAQFTAVYEKGKAWVSPFVVLRALPNDLGYKRCGFVTGKSVGNAVVRNRVKRLLREIVRLTPVTPGWDLVFIARKNAATADYHELRQAVLGLLRRARLTDVEGAEARKKQG